MLPAFTCAYAISNLWSICLKLNILRSETVATRATRDKIRVLLHVFFIYLASDTIEE